MPNPLQDMPQCMEPSTGDPSRWRFRNGSQNMCFVKNQQELSGAFCCMYMTHALQELVESISNVTQSLFARAVDLLWRSDTAVVS
jgi:hypothetical protein